MEIQWIFSLSAEIEDVIKLTPLGKKLVLHFGLEFKILPFLDMHNDKKGQNQKKMHISWWNNPVM